MAYRVFKHRAERREGHLLGALLLAGYKLAPDRGRLIVWAGLSIIALLLLASQIDLRLHGENNDFLTLFAFGAAILLCLFIFAGLILSLRRVIQHNILSDVMQSTTKISSMVFVILIGAALFSLVFKGFEGDEFIYDFLSDLPGGKASALILVMLVMFFLGFFLDFIEITFVVVPIVAPVLLQMDIHPIWLGVMMAMNLQTSFLTPPFGFALFYLRGVAPKGVTTWQIYKGVLPFVAIQIAALYILWTFPSLTTWLPQVIFSP